MPADIQIAFQGGGAKFIAMLPIAEAFQASQAAGKINIKAVSGTSAGALCAALLAADCNFKELKAYLIAAGPNHVEKLMGPDYQQLRHLVDAKVVREASRITKLHISFEKSVLQRKSYSIRRGIWRVSR